MGLFYGWLVTVGLDMIQSTKTKANKNNRTGITMVELVLTVCLQS